MWQLAHWRFYWPGDGHVLISKTGWRDYSANWHKILTTSRDHVFVWGFLYFIIRIQRETANMYNFCGLAKLNNTRWQANKPRIGVAKQSWHDDDCSGSFDTGMGTLQSNCYQPTRTGRVFAHCKQSRLFVGILYPFDTGLFVLISFALLCRRCASYFTWMWWMRCLANVNKKQPMVAVGVLQWSFLTIILVLIGIWYFSIYTPLFGWYWLCTYFEIHYWMVVWFHKDLLNTAL